MTDPAEEEDPHGDRELRRPGNTPGTEPAALPEVAEAKAGHNVLPVSATPGGDAGTSTNESDGGASRTLGWLLDRRPFFDYFVYVASMSYDGDDLGAKVRKLQKDRFKLHRFCVIADVLTQAAVIGCLVVISIAIAYKTLAPFPPFWR